MVEPLNNAGKATYALSGGHVTQAVTQVYTREAFRAILERQPEWKIRAALEDGNIPSSNIEHTVEWLDELEQAQQHRGYLS
jgi:hypothetical protein